MKRNVFISLVLALFLVGNLASLVAQQMQPWIHVHVTDPAENGKQARVNLPLALAEVALELVSEEVMNKGRIKLSQHDVSVRDLRLMWKELKASGDAEFVTIREQGKLVRVLREGNRIRVYVDEHDGDAQKTVRIDLPVTLVDALLSGEGEELDLAAAVNELRGERGDIVTVVDGDKRVRVWIDESKS